MAAADIWVKGYLRARGGAKVHFFVILKIF